MGSLQATIASLNSMHGMSCKLKHSSLDKKCLLGSLRFHEQELLNQADCTICYGALKVILHISTGTDLPRGKSNLPA